MSSDRSESAKPTPPPSIPENWSIFVERTGDFDVRALCDELVRSGCASFVTVYGSLVYDVSVGLVCERAPQRLRDILELLEDKPSLVICGGHRSELVSRLHSLVPVGDPHVEVDDPHPEPLPQGLVSRKTVAQAFGVSVRTLMDYLRDPTFPGPVMREDYVFFEVDPVARWAAAHGKALDARLFPPDRSEMPTGP